MTVIASSVAALNLLRKYKCPHCGSEQNRVLPEEGSMLECFNCLKAFSPTASQVKRPQSRKRRR